MELNQEEKDMLLRIQEKQFTGGAYKRATFVDQVCCSKEDRVLLRDLCRKGLVETGLGGTVAGDVYDGCWLTQRGRELLGVVDE